MSSELEEQGKQNKGKKMLLNRSRNHYQRHKNRKRKLIHITREKLMKKQKQRGEINWDEQHQENYDTLKKLLQ